MTQEEKLEFKAAVKEIVKNNMDKYESKEEIIGKTKEFFETQTECVTEEELDEIISELRSDVEVNTTDEVVAVKSNKPTLLQQWKNKFIEPFETKPLFISTASRLQKLAGIKPTPVARLTIKDKEVKLNDYPTLFELLRYKVAGFKYEVLKPKE